MSENRSVNMKNSRFKEVDENESND